LDIAVLGFGTLTKGVEYPPQILDGTEDDLVNLIVVGLPLSPVWEYQTAGPIDRPPLYQANHVVLKGDKTIGSVNASSGDEEWRYESAYRIAPPNSENVGVLDEVVVFQTDRSWHSRL
jgi:hypothetical protein